MVNLAVNEYTPFRYWVSSISRRICSMNENIIFLRRRISILFTIVPTIIPIINTINRTLYFIMFRNFPPTW